MFRDKNILITGASYGLGSFLAKGWESWVVI